MKNITQKITKNIAFLAIALLVGITSVYAAGTLTPVGTAGDDTHYSLKDIEAKLTDFTATPTATSSPFTDPESVSATFPTLTEIYDLLVAEDANIVPEKILAGTTIFGVEGTLVQGTPELEWSTQQNNVDWPEATLYCSTLTEGSVEAGTWRMPTIHELEDAITADLSDGTGDTFTNNREAYWSGTEDSVTYAFATSWDLQRGDVLDISTNIRDKSINSLVRCVR